MTEYQIMSWRELPTLVVARDGDDVVKVPLSSRLQEAVDEAAMRVGAAGSDDYLDGWTRSAWEAADGSPTDVAERVGADLESRWDDTAVTAYLDALGPAQDPTGRT